MIVVFFFFVVVFWWTTLLRKPADMHPHSNSPGLRPEPRHRRTPFDNSPNSCPPGTSGDVARRSGIELSVRFLQNIHIGYRGSLVCYSRRVRLRQRVVVSGRSRWHRSNDTHDDLRLRWSSAFGCGDVYPPPLHQPSCSSHDASSAPQRPCGPVRSGIFFRPPNAPPLANDRGARGIGGGE